MIRQFTFFLTLLLSAANVVLGQQKAQQILLEQSFPSDSLARASFFRTLEHTFKLTPMNSTPSEIEVRMLTIPSASNEGSLLVIRSTEKGWEALEYKYFYRTDAQGHRRGSYKYIVEEKQPTRNWDDFWKLAIDNRLLTLPGQPGLQDKVLKAFANAQWNEESVDQSQLKPQDGKSYYLEIKVGDKFRYYGYEDRDKEENTDEIKNVVYLFNRLLKQESAFL